MFRHARFRLKLSVFVISCAAHALVGVAFAQQPSPTAGGDHLKALLERMKANIHQNKQVAARYTYDGVSSIRTYNRKGKLTNKTSHKWVTVTIDGVAYRRIVEVNGKPLSAEKQIAEQKRSETLAELGKDYDFVFQFMATDPQDYIYSDLPISQLDTLFDNRVVGHESINGRDNLVIESTPKADAKADSDRAMTALDWKEKTWIDIEDAMPTQYAIELLNDKDYLQRGTSFTIEYTRLPIDQSGTSNLPPKVWLIHSLKGYFSIRIASEIETGVTQTDYYNYKRFQAEVHLLDNSVQQVPDTKQGTHP